MVNLQVFNSFIVGSTFFPEILPTINKMNVLKNASAQSTQNRLYRSHISLASQASNTNTQSNLSFVDNEFEFNMQKIKAESDPEKRILNLREFFGDILEDKDYFQAYKVINYFSGFSDIQHQLHKVFVHHLLEEGQYEEAIELNENYPDESIKTKNSEYIVKFLLDEGEILKAADVQGQQNFQTITKLNLQAALNQAKRTYGGLFDSIVDLFDKDTLSEDVSEAALKVVGKQYRHEWLGGGRLACAYTVSRIFDHIPELTSISSAEVNNLTSQMMKEGGFKLIHGSLKQKKTPIRGKIDYKAGDVVVFARKGKWGYGHVGVVSRVKEDGTPMMVHNSSSRRQVVEVPLNRYSRTPTGVFRV